MDRPLVPDGVVVGTDDLQEFSKSYSFHIQQRQVDSARSGRALGLDISIGSPASRFSFTAGHAYTPRGDYVESAGVTNLPLADYTTGTENLAVLIYRETLSEPEAYEDGGSTRNTLATRSSEFKFITRAMYNALPVSASSDLETNLDTADLTADSQDRMAILASVFGKGFTGSTPNTYSGAQATDSTAATGDFANQNIVQQRIFERLLSVTPPTTVTIPGVNFKVISENMSLGTGSLATVVTGSGTGLNWAFTWIAPGDSGSPTAVNVTPAVLPQTPIPLTSPNGTMKVTIEVVTNLLPTTNATYTDVYTVTDLYADLGPAYSVSDELHRNKIGTYVPTQKDPHGTGYPDFAQQVAVIPSPIVAGTGYLSNTTLQALARFLVPANVSGRTGLFEEGADGSIHIRGYYNPDKLRFEITINAKWDGSAWLPDVTSATAQMYTFAATSSIASLEDGMNGYVKAAGSGGFSDTAWDTVALPIAMGTVIGELLRDTTANTTVPRIQINRSLQGPRTLAFRDDANGAGGTLPIEVYLCMSSSTAGFTGPCFEICVNAHWNYATALWNRGVSGLAAKLAIGPAGIQVVTFDATSTTAWNDDFTTGAHWSLAFQSGSVLSTVGGSLQVGGNLTDPTVYRIGSTGTGLTRTLIQQHVLGGGTPGGVYTYRKYAYFDTVNTFFEECMGCRWDGANWQPDLSGGVAFLQRYGSAGSAWFRKGTTSGPWGDGAWDFGSVGIIQLDTTGTGTSKILSNGVQPGSFIGGSPTLGAVYTDNTIKASACIRHNGPYPGTYSIISGFNVSSITRVAATTGNSFALQINFTTNVSSTSYAFIPDVNVLRVTNFNDGFAGDSANTGKVIVYEKNAASCIVQYENFNGSNQGDGATLGAHAGLASGNYIEWSFIIV